MRAMTLKLTLGGGGLVISDCVSKDRVNEKLSPHRDAIEKGKENA